MRYLMSKIKSFIKMLLAKRPIVMNANIVQLGPTELLKGRAALITGGTSGIGYAIADAMLRAGADAVVITGRSETRLKCAAEKLQSASQDRRGRVFWEQMDMCQIDSLQECFDRITAKISNKISILVNNAGVLGATFGQAEEKEYDAVLDTNLKGAFFLSQIIAHYMKDSKIEGNILNICSSSSLRPASSAYILSKWGLKGLTQGMAKQLAPYGIIVNGLAPGPTATPMLLTDVEKQGLFHPNIPVGRYASPDEMGNMAVMLTSGIGRMIVGDIIYMTGGAGVITYDDLQYSFV